MVTGGAGYIGAHAVERLSRRGDFVFIVDNLSTGEAKRLSGKPFLKLDLTDADAPAILSEQMESFKIDSVIHFAGKKRVDESIARPDWYFDQNMGSLNSVLSAMQMTQVKKLVFSSSAAVYGESSGLVTEQSPTKPINPYGETKLQGENLISSEVNKQGISAASLRYFNVAGSDSPSMRDEQITNLIPIVIEKLVKNESPVIFGDDYPTPDGTCIRDFVHVSDLADAHLAVLDKLTDQAGHEVFNVGTGRGYSVKEVIDLARRLMDKSEVLPTISERRFGDPAKVVAKTEAIRQSTGWFAKYGLEQILESTIAAMT